MLDKVVNVNMMSLKSNFIELSYESKLIRKIFSVFGIAVTWLIALGTLGRLAARDGLIVFCIFLHEWNNGFVMTISNHPLSNLILGYFSGILFQEFIIHGE